MQKSQAKRFWDEIQKKEQANAFDAQPEEEQKSPF